MGQIGLHTRSELKDEMGQAIIQLRHYQGLS
jgi:hypothetical protein